MKPWHEQDCDEHVIESKIIPVYRWSSSGRIIGRSTRLPVATRLARQASRTQEGIITVTKHEGENDEYITHYEGGRQVATHGNTHAGRKPPAQQPQGVEELPGEPLRTAG